MKLKGRTLNYWILGILSLVLTVLSYISQLSNPWLSSGLSNLATGFIASVIIYYLIEQIIEKNKKEEERKRKQICYRRLYYPLSRYMGFLKRLYNDTRNNPPDEIPETLSDMFDSEFIENCEMLDWSSDPDFISQRTWRDYIFFSNSTLIKDLNEILDMYSYALDTETINLIEDIIQSSFMYVSGSIMDNISSFILNFPVVGKIGNFFRAGDDFLKVISLIIQLVKEINPHIKHPITVDQSSFGLDSSWGTARLQE